MDEKWINGKFRKKKICWRPKLGGVGNLTFFHMIDINKMAAIFQFFHNGQHWYSISINTQKIRDPKIGVISNLKFFCMIDINEMAAIFQFFHNGQHLYSISVDTWKTGNPNFWGVSNLKFFYMIDINKIAGIFQFFHNGQCWYSINTGKTAGMNLIQFSKFSVGSLFPITHPGFCFNINAWLCLKYFCVVIFLHSENQRFSFLNFPLV